MTAFHSRMMTSDSNLKPARLARRSAPLKSSKSVTEPKTNDQPSLFSHECRLGHASLFRIIMVTVAEEKKDEDSVQRSLELKVNHGGGRRRTSSSKTTGGGGGSGSTRRASSSSTSSKKAKEDALAHLVRYETMVRQQEAEDMATLAYMKPCLERLIQLAEPTTSAAAAATAAGGRMDQTLSFRSLRSAREKLDAIERDPNRQSESKEFLATDRQLLMVLRILTKNDEEVFDDDKTTLTWAEFVQCYKVCIAGMLTLQQLATAPSVPAPKGSHAADSSDAYSDSLSLASLRSRTRDRTISMMSLFGSSSTKMLNSSAAKAAASSRRKATASAASRVFWFAIKASLILLVAVASLIGASWMYHYAHHSAAMRGRNKPPRFVPLTSLYPPHFYNTSPMTTASTRGGDVPAFASFPSRTPPFHPQAIAPVSRAAARIFSPQDHAPLPPLPSGAVANQDNKNRHHSLGVWQLAIGGAVALPLTTQLLFPPAVAGRFVATASLLMVAAVGAATNVLATLCARALVRIRQWLVRTPSSTAHP